jgi:hypothetical protein
VLWWPRVPVSHQAGLPGPCTGVKRPRPDARTTSKKIYFRKKMRFYKKDFVKKLVQGPRRPLVALSGPASPGPITCTFGAGDRGADQSPRAPIPPLRCLASGPGLRHRNDCWPKKSFFRKSFFSQKFEICILHFGCIHPRGPPGHPPPAHVHGPCSTLESLILLPSILPSFVQIQARPEKIPPTPNPESHCIQYPVG